MRYRLFRADKQRHGHKKGGCDTAAPDPSIRDHLFAVVPNWHKLKCFGELGDVQHHGQWLDGRLNKAVVQVEFLGALVNRMA